MKREHMLESGKMGFPFLLPAVPTDRSGYRKPQRAGAATSQRYAAFTYR